MRYELQLMDTLSGVGCFQAFPASNMSYSQMLEHLRTHPYDEFMHQFLLRNIGEQRKRKVIKDIKQAVAEAKSGEMVTAALLYEACMTHSRLFDQKHHFEKLDMAELSRHSPTIHLRALQLQDSETHRAWIDLFRQNITAHEPLPSPAEAGLSAPFEPEAERPAVVDAATVLKTLKTEGLPEPLQRRPLEETIEQAVSTLEKLDIPLGPEMQHKACLSPHARLRHWRVKVSCTTGEQKTSLSGIQTSYGRGLAPEAAQASYCMEMAERASSYASVGKQGVLGRTREYPLFHGSYQDASQRMEALDPNSLNLEVPYTGQPLWWMEGHISDGRGTRPVLVPLQLVFLFCNLEEQSLYSALGSTGLASGNTLYEAKLAGLCEALERDADAVQPFDPSRCFRLQSDDPEIGKLLDGYADYGIDVWFMDMTGDFGIPCYKAMVVGKHGDVNQGMGCGLDARRALVSGMTETPYPYPGPPSARGPETLPVRRLEDLPDLSTGSAEGDVLLIERTLAANGYEPVYVELTRKDIGIPVVRAIVPGLELVADFDHFSRVSKRLFQNYLRMFES